VAEIDDLISELRREEAQHDLYGVATEDDVRVTETALGRSLPESFRTFVTTFSNGAYLYGVQEVSRVGTGNAQIAAIQEIDRIWSGERDEEVPFREHDGGVPYEDLIPYSLDSNGNEWCFVAGEAVAYLDTAGKKLYSRLDSFAAWIRLLVESPEDEVIRTLYRDDDGVIYDELMLG
jgi:hypothetical protein